MDISTQLKSRESEKGFTLVELAVVMIIIGLLIGGILKGQELITNARLTTTINQMEALGGAYNGFVDKYNVQPGDMIAANNRLQGCAGPCIGPAGTDGNGVIDSIIGAVATNNGEDAAFFGQLLAGDFITGLDGTANLGFGTTHPTAPIGGGFKVGDGRAGAAVGGFTVAAVRPRPHVVLDGLTAVTANGTGVLDPSQAANVDRRLDDGIVNTGTVLGVAAAAACGAAAYAENLPQQRCALAYRL